ncbi:MAG TPA: methyl-accepting chemotaxis protein [Polyangiaceae bacterium]|nr:methyl-accepting chemotaxis protein [Polyangiaceae bacterium]
MPSLQNRSFGQLIVSALGAISVLAVVANVVGIIALKTVVTAKDRVIDRNAQTLIDIEAARVVRERRAKLVRSFVIAGKDKFFDQAQESNVALQHELDSLHQRATSNDERKLVAEVIKRNDAQRVAWDELMRMKKSGASLEALSEYLTSQSSSTVAALDEAFVSLTELERAELNRAQTEATNTAEHAIWMLALSAVVTSALAIVLSLLLSKALRQRIGAAVHGVQSSSTELEAAAHQQVSSTEELTSTTNEITVTIRELLATSRQIAESSQSVVRIAEETGRNAAAGDQTVQKSQAAISRIKGQVDQIVARMVDLGRKSQQIGSILELINELADQTNILSINATIEAAGAGESGRRFAVVADEVRRLADRVGGSAREIRGLIDEIRSAANATVMATEDGSKSVDAGANQFSEVLSTFSSISERVRVTTDAAREIELSTKQQTAAVEQLNAAIGGVAQAARETQSSSSQTLATCSELAKVSRQLSLLIRDGNSQIEHRQVA